ncbi:hypothetical protein GIB67_004044 [Kingdonia uniflora]|uniref:KIB1-4 beta-propeller domain-containing protein n=1 Tax=Kingdonia uniflora TaxID=39325 RepID=A0A7J7NRR4_9MAGN|nr:hypothetical protein GIB67_004044 [Kingdonia uniflora]
MGEISTHKRCRALKRVDDDKKQRRPTEGLTTSLPQLPEELIGEIAKRVIYINDFYTFGSVCQSWRYVTKQKHYYSSVRELPWLMLSETSEDNNVCSFFSLSTNKVFSFQLPEAKGRQCSFGLGNHIRGDFYLCQLFIKKFIFASTQNNNGGGLIVFAIYSNTRKLAMARSGDEAWTSLVYQSWRYVTKQKHYYSSVRELPWLMLSETSEDNNVCSFFSLSTNKVFSFQLPEAKGRQCSFGLGNHIRGDFYLCQLFIKKFIIASTQDNNGGGLIVFAIYSNTRKLAMARSGDEAWTSLDGIMHIVSLWLQLSGNLSMGCHQYTTMCFEIYKCNLHTKRWSKRHSSYGLGGFSLFVGANSSFALSDSDYPELKRNCIYFTDDTCLYYQYECGRYNMGVFDFKKLAIQPLYSVPGTISQFSPPVWFRPNPW